MKKLLLCALLSVAAFSANVKGSINNEFSGSYNGAKKSASSKSTLELNFTDINLKFKGVLKANLLDLFVNTSANSFSGTTLDVDYRTKELVKATTMYLNANTDIFAKKLGFKIGVDSKIDAFTIKGELGLSGILQTKHNFLINPKLHLDYQINKEINVGLTANAQILPVKESSDSYKYYDLYEKDNISALPLADFEYPIVHSYEIDVKYNGVINDKLNLFVQNAIKNNKEVDKSGVVTHKENFLLLNIGFNNEISKSFGNFDFTTKQNLAAKLVNYSKEYTSRLSANSYSKVTWIKGQLVGIVSYNAQVNDKFKVVPSFEISATAKYDSSITKNWVLSIPIEFIPKVVLNYQIINNLNLIFEGQATLTVTPVLSRIVEKDLLTQKEIKFTSLSSSVAPKAKASIKLNYAW